MLDDIRARWAPPGLEEQGFEPVEPWNADSFKAHTSLALLTEYGRFDIWFRPDGTGGYDDLIERAVELEAGDLQVTVVHLEDSIRIKRAVGGARYLEQIPLLLDLQRRRSEQGLP